jgi:hypothetical protein
MAKKKRVTRSIALKNEDDDTPPSYLRKRQQILDYDQRVGGLRGTLEARLRIWNIPVYVCRGAA